METEWITIAQAMQRVQVSRRTIYHWADAGKLVVCRTAGGMLRIEASSLFRTMEMATLTPPTEDGNG